MKTSMFLTVAGVATLLSTTALAADVSNASAKKMPDDSYVTISGTVESVQNEREFKLRDNTGTIGVDIKSNQSVVLKPGQYVTVSGTVDNDLGMVDIDATDVYAHKGFTRSVSDALRGMKGVSTSDAQAFNIKDLPKEGMVKVTGTVTDVDNEKEFTLRDESGSINVDIESNEKAALKKGARVTVIGSVDSGALGKDINATQVIVVADAQPAKN